jgi:predicted membrane protein
MRHYHHHSSDFKCGKRSNSKVRGFVFGFFLLAAGTILILGNTGTIDKGLFQYIFSWQSLLISFGILILSGGIRQHWFGSMLMITIGTIFLLDEIYQFKTGVANMIWPAVLIIIGLAIIGKIFFPKKKVVESKSDKYAGFGEFKGEKNGDEYVNVSRVFSGINLESNSENFKGGQLSFVFGGGEIDLRGAKLAEGLNILKVECVFGGVKIFIPDDWDVNLETSGVFGGFSDERRHIPYENVDRTRNLVIKAEAVFGGGEITN